jgi:hypothetical protein
MLRPLDAMTTIRSRSQCDQKDMGNLAHEIQSAFPFLNGDPFPRNILQIPPVIDTVQSFGIQPKRTRFRSSWQNGVAERWVGNCGRDLLDHVILSNERHLKRLMNEYVRYYREDRTHLALAKGTPEGREAVSNSGVGNRIVAMPRPRELRASKTRAGHKTR